MCTDAVTICYCCKMSKVCVFAFLTATQGVWQMPASYLQADRLFKCDSAKERESVLLSCLCHSSRLNNWVQDHQLKDIEAVLAYVNIEASGTRKMKIAKLKREHMASSICFSATDHITRWLMNECMKINQ